MYHARLSYAGPGQCLAEALPGGTCCLTIAVPESSGGPGGGPCPIDLLGQSLLSCVAIVMGMVAQKQGLDLTGMVAEAELTLSDGQPRRVAAIKTRFTVPETVPADKLATLKQAAELCPIHNSLHAQTALEIVVVRGPVGAASTAAGPCCAGSTKPAKGKKSGGCCC